MRKEDKVALEKELEELQEKIKQAKEMFTALNSLPVILGVIGQKLTFVSSIVSHAPVRDENEVNGLRNSISSHKKEIEDLHNAADDRENAYRDLRKAFLVSAKNLMKYGNRFLPSTGTHLVSWQDNVRVIERFVNLIRKLNTEPEVVGVRGILERVKTKVQESSAKTEQLFSVEPAKNIACKTYEHLLVEILVQLSLYALLCAHGPTDTVTVSADVDTELNGTVVYFSVKTGFYLTDHRFALLAAHDQHQPHLIHSGPGLAFLGSLFLPENPHGIRFFQIPTGTESIVLAPYVIE